MLQVAKETLHNKILYIHLCDKKLNKLNKQNIDVLVCDFKVTYGYRRLNYTIYNAFISSINLFNKI